MFIKIQILRFNWPKEANVMLKTTVDKTSTDPLDHNFSVSVLFFLHNLYACRDVSIFGLQNIEKSLHNGGLSDAAAGVSRLSHQSIFIFARMKGFI